MVSATLNGIRIPMPEIKIHPEYRPCFYGSPKQPTRFDLAVLNPLTEELTRLTYEKLKVLGSYNISPRIPLSLRR